MSDGAWSVITSSLCLMSCVSECSDRLKPWNNSDFEENEKEEEEEEENFSRHLSKTAVKCRLSIVLCLYLVLECHALKDSMWNLRSKSHS